MAYLAHTRLGDVFGTAYDLSTIAILRFAGASGMAGLLNLVPRYLPRHGMAPEWAKATLPLVTLFAAVTFLTTVLFKANLEAQAGAYATGVLVLMTSAAIAVTLMRGGTHRIVFGTITLVFAYTTFIDVIERPDGVKIASWFIVAIISTSLISQVMRSTELRVQAVETDALARQFITAAAAPVGIIANRPDTGDPAEYEIKEVDGVPMSVQVHFALRAWLQAS